MLMAQCDLRQDIRQFCLSRMTELVEPDEQFERFHLQVSLRFNDAVSDKVKEL